MHMHVQITHTTQTDLAKLMSDCPLGQEGLSNNADAMVCMVGSPHGSGQ
jgi:hypothetical protein